MALPRTRHLYSGAGYREAKVKIPGMDKPQSVFVVRAVARSSGDQGGSGAVTWSVIWPNGYYLTSDDLPDGIRGAVGSGLSVLAVRMRSRVKV